LSNPTNRDNTKAKDFGIKTKPYVTFSNKNVTFLNGLPRPCTLNLFNSGSSIKKLLAMGYFHKGRLPALKLTVLVFAFFFIVALLLYVFVITG
jgi:hypothetical protein